MADPLRRPDGQTLDGPLFGHFLSCPDTPLPITDARAADSRSQVLGLVHGAGLTRRNRKIKVPTFFVYGEKDYTISQSRLKVRNFR